MYTIKEICSGASMMMQSVLGKKREYGLLFNKEKDGCWYVAFPHWPFSHNNLAMVSGADKLLELLSDGALCIVNQSTIKVLRSLWEYGVCSYWHYNDEERQILDDMHAKEWLVKDNHLLSKPERDYFSYYLDNAKFTNGTAYRNHYMHGSTPPVDDEKEHQIVYITFLRLFAILLLKIEDDLWLARRALAIHVMNKIEKKQNPSEMRS